MAQRRVQDGVHVNSRWSAPSFSDRAIRGRKRRNGKSASPLGNGRPKEEDKERKCQSPIGNKVGTNQRCRHVHNICRLSEKSVGSFWVYYFSSHDGRQTAAAPEQGGVEGGLGRF